MVSYAQRAGYLRSKLGSQVKAAAELGVSRSTFQDIEKGLTVKPTKRVRDSLNKTFRDEATPAVLEREREGKFIGFALSDKTTAEASEKSMLASERETLVTVRQTFQYQKFGLGAGRQDEVTLYGRGRTTDEARESLGRQLAIWKQQNEVQYEAVEIVGIGTPQYRVYERRGDY
jgi:DNA-binding XRE family transcriptional regulator